MKSIVKSRTFGFSGFLDGRGLFLLGRVLWVFLGDLLGSLNNRHVQVGAPVPVPVIELRAITFQLGALEVQAFAFEAIAVRLLLQKILFRLHFFQLSLLEAQFGFLQGAPC